MVIKKYIAKSFQEGKQQIFAELGDDAVILSTRSSKPNEAGETVVEIVAAVENKQDGEKQTKTKPLKDKLANIPFPERNNLASQKEENSDLYSKKILQEIASLKNILLDTNDVIRYRISSNMPNSVAQIYKKMIDAEVEEDYAFSICEKIMIKHVNPDYELILPEARHVLSKDIKISNTLEIKDKCQKLAFIGTSGTGKTLTLIKVAVICKLILKARVLVITSDTYKVGAVEQLQTYCGITSINHKIVYNAKELQFILDSEKDYDFILFDSTGTSQNDEKNINEVSSFLNILQADETYLVQDATCNRTTFGSILKAFEPLNISSVILTKLDEAIAIGGLISKIVKSNLPISFTTAGSQIPEDIDPANKEIISTYILHD